MRTIRFAKLLAATLALAGFTLSGCTEGANNPSPVDLVVSANQTFPLVDLFAEECEILGTVQVRPVVKNSDATDARFLDVRLSSYRISYRRRDGGTLVPDTVHRTIGVVVPADTAVTLPLKLPIFPVEEVTPGALLVLEPGASQRAPFVSLLGSNGGVDPETGRRNVTLEGTIDFYGETLSGENVSGRTRIEYTVCLGCAPCGQD